MNTALAHVHITLSELQARVKQSLAEQFALPLWVVAEISELKVNYSGHCYLELVEKGESDGLAKAQVRAVIWRSHYARVAAYFEAETGKPLTAGLKILFKATVNYHELYGFSLQISEIDTAYTLGDLERQRQATIARLQQEGVWELNREQPMPPVVQRIAVVSSSRAAGYQDFCNELKKSPYAFHITLFEAVVQGDAAEDSLVAALYEVAERAEEFDAVALLRGGGSANDLNCFNSYRLCNHIAQFPLPVLTGIGHHKDISVADMVAHTALKTPTAVAGWFVERMQQVEGWLDTAALTLHDAALTLSRNELLHLERLAGELRNRSEQLLRQEEQRLETLKKRLPEEALRFVVQQQERLEGYSRLAESNSPRRIMRLGFSVVRKMTPKGERGPAIGNTGILKSGDRVVIELCDGEQSATLD